ncbi:MAG: hypothetical protein U1F76_30545 [Candidatus Competibacteraceae bacterium]
MTNLCLKRLALLIALGLLGNALAGCYYLGQKGNLYLPDETPQSGKQKSTSTSR